MTISVPAVLRKRLDKIRGENWSAIACVAFARRISEIEAARTDSETVDDAAVRLTQTLSQMQKATERLTSLLTKNKKAS